MYKSQLDLKQTAIVLCEQLLIENKPPISGMVINYGFSLPLWVEIQKHSRVAKDKLDMHIPSPVTLLPWLKQMTVDAQEQHTVSCFFTRCLILMAARLKIFTGNEPKTRNNNQLRQIIAVMKI